jgi:hypothetical protein
MEVKTELPGLIRTNSPGYINDPELLKDTAFDGLHNRLVSGLGNLETDIDEIRERQEIFKTIFRHPKAVREIVHSHPDWRLPNGYTGLKDYFSGILSANGPGFYDVVRRVISNMQHLEEESPSGPGTNSSRLRETRRKLEDMLLLAEGENALMQKIREEAKKVHKFVGSISIVWSGYENVRVLQSESYGFRVYPLEKSEYDSSHETPRSILDDVADFVKTRLVDQDGYYSALHKVFAKLGFLADYHYEYGRLEVGLGIDVENSSLTQDAIDDARNLTCSIDISQVKPQPARNERKSKLGRMYARFLYNIRMNSERRKIRKFLKRAESRALENIVIKWDAEIRSRSGVIPSNNSDAEFQREAIDMIFRRYSDDLKQYQHARDEFRYFLSDLNEYVVIAEHFFGKQSANYPVTFPTILPSRERRLEIKDLYPARLSDARVDSVTPNDVNCNGVPTVITGPNAGGKSVYLVSVIDAILMAQAGMPILASSAEMSIKDALFTHFIKDGNVRRCESTFASSMERFRMLFSELPKYQNPHITIDELAAGTDPQSAYDVSARIVKALVGVSSKASSFVVTQFRDVAEMAGRYGAKTLRVKDYRLEPGASEAMGLELAERIGLTEEFVDGIISECAKK